MKAVLWDMDGTLVDSEKLWDVSLAALYEKLGGVLTPAVRASIVGSVAENTMRIIYTDLGLELDPAAMSESSDWLNDYTEKLFEAVCRGATARSSCWTRSPPTALRWHWSPTPIGPSPTRR